VTFGLFGSRREHLPGSYWVKSGWSTPKVGKPVLRSAPGSAPPARAGRGRRGSPSGRAFRDSIRHNARLIARTYRAHALVLDVQVRNVPRRPATPAPRDSQARHGYCLGGHGNHAQGNMFEPRTSPKSPPYRTQRSSDRPSSAEILRRGVLRRSPVAH
jgi:hypothetical protein